MIEMEEGGGEMKMVYPMLHWLEKYMVVVGVVNDRQRDIWKKHTKWPNG